MLGAPWVHGAHGARPRGAGRVIIVGAGMAGLGAARTLNDQYGFSAPNQVILLEGRDRIGGRIHTSRTLTTPVELGAAWIHGAQGNPITAIANAAGLETHKTDYGSINVFAQDGHAFSDADYDRVEDNAWAPKLQQALTWAESRDTDPSLAASLSAVQYGSGLSVRDRQLLDWIRFWDIELDLTCNDSSLSGWWYDSDLEFSGADLLIPSGYDQIVNHVATGLDIRMGHVVDRIEWSTTGVVVKTNRGSFEAEHCICTLPLGVLKSPRVVFSPRLPSGIQGAIGRLGFGRAFKMALKFPKLYWDADEHFFGVVGATRPQSIEMLNMTSYTQQPMLLIEANQDLAATLESATETEAVSRVMLDVRRAFGASVAEPTAVVRTNWGSSPFTRGSYSYMAVGSSPQDQQALAAGAGTGARLVFAGEHCSWQYPGTVHGAWLSGLAAAARVNTG